MKKIILVLLFLAVVSGICYALVPTGSVTTLNAITYTAISIPKSNGKCRDVAVAISDNLAWTLSYDAAGTLEIPIPAPGKVDIGCVTDTAGVIFYAKASAATPTLSLVIGGGR